MEERAAGRRRIDRATAPDLLEGIGEQPAESLRALRDDCREEETRLSYARRVVQGQLDIARMELSRRRGSGEEPRGEPRQRDDRELVEELSSVLADQPSSSPREARTMTFYTPDEEQPDRRDDDLQLPSLGQLPDLDDDRLTELVEQLEAQEAKLSQARRAVLTNLDGLQAELVRRYREGDADLDAIVSAALPRRRDEGGAG